MDNVKTRVLHNTQHTSSVNCLCVPGGDFLCTGGSDKKVVGWDMEKDSVVSRFVLNARVTPHALPSPSPSPCLISFLSIIR